MAQRRRDCRAPIATDRGTTDPVPSSDHKTQPRPTATLDSFACQCLLFFSSFLLVLLLTGAIVVYHRGPAQVQTGVDEETILSVRVRGLVKPEVSFQEILAEGSRASVNTTSRQFENPVLAYVTPWNSLGYEMAEKYGSKLTHISPVWYELKSDGKKLVLEGRHNADLGWISKLRASGESLVVPRFVIEAFPSDFLLKKQQRSEAVDIIENECKEMGYDGVVLESWSRWMAYGVLRDTAMRNTALQFVKQLGQALHSLNSETKPDHHLELIYVIPAPRSEDLKEHDFSPEDLQQLSDDVDGFSLMTYDFSGSPSPGPNAPLIWIRSCLQLLLGNNGSHDTSLARKIFLGINFYGNDFILSGGFGGGAITGRDYISLLERHKPTLHWEGTSAEHFFVYYHHNIKHAVFYPSLMSISTRLDEARAWGVSLSIWEIGQGLNYFFDIL